MWTITKEINLLDDWGESVGYHSEGNEKGDDEDDTGGEDLTNILK